MDQAGHGRGRRCRREHDGNSRPPPVTGSSEGRRPHPSVPRRQTDQGELPGPPDLGRVRTAAGLHDLARSLRARQRTTRHYRDGVRSAQVGHRGRHGRNPAHQDRPVPTPICLCRRPRRRSMRTRRVGHPGDRRLYHPPRPHYRAKGRRLRDRSRRGPLGLRRRTWPSTASPFCCTACWTIWSTGISGRWSRSTRRSRRPRTASSTPSGAIEQVQRRSFQQRKSLVLLRRIVLPTREVVNTLLRHDLDFVPDPMAPLLPRCLRPRHAGHRMDRVAP